MVISKDFGNFDSPIKQTQTSLISSQKQRNKSCFGTLLMLFALNYAALKITIIPKWVLRDLVRFRSQPLVDNFINILRAAFYKVIREKLCKSLCYKKKLFLNVDENDTFSHFHQNFTNSFWANILLSKNYKA